MLNLNKKREIILHFNKQHLIDQTIPMWVIKCGGESYYVNHVNVDKGIGFTTKNTPNNKHTKGSLKFKGVLEILNNENETIANIK